MMIYNSNNIPAIHTYKDAVRYGARVLKQADIDNPDYDALELFLYVTGIDRTTYLINATDEIDNEALRKYLGYIIKRSHHIPLLSTHPASYPVAAPWKNHGVWMSVYSDRMYQQTAAQ